MKTVGEFEIVDHGIDHPDYFQGCGICGTRFEWVTTGCGDNPTEALEDCLEGMANMDFEVEGMENRILADLDLETFPTSPAVAECGEDDEVGSEAYYYISIRWNDDLESGPNS